MTGNDRDDAAVASTSDIALGKRFADGSPAASQKPDDVHQAKRAKLDGDNQESSTTNGEQAPAGSTEPAGSSTSVNDGSNRGSQQQRGRGRGRGGKKSRGSRKDNRERGPQPERIWGAREKIDKQRDTTWKSKDDDEDDATGLNRDGTPKLKKKKVAMLIGYSGLGYNGSQINPGVKTIEQEVFDACVKAGAISQDNSDNTQKVSLMRAARTDAGVSAAINVLNLKLILSPPSMPEGGSLEEHINSFLPPAVRIWKIIRVTGGFHSRTMCDSRMYNYSLPTYCFVDPKPSTSMGDRRDKNAPGAENWWKQYNTVRRPVDMETEDSANGAVTPETKGADDQSDQHSASESKGAAVADGSAEAAKEGKDETEGPSVPSAFREDQKLRKTYRISPSTLTRLRSTLEAYSGSHNFWNFTVGKEFGDRSCQRVMKRLTVTDPFIVGDSEWISLKFHGQSFMLHQIRKMVGLIIMAVRTYTPPSLIPETFGPARLNIPKAPALGLLLEQPQFESYNRKIAQQNAQIEKKKKASASAPAADETPSKTSVEPTADDAEDDSNAIRDPVEYTTFEQQVEDFKRDVVYKNMHEEEERDDTYGKWLNLHDSQIGTDFDYLNAKGVIPPSAHLADNKKKPKQQQQASSHQAGGQKISPQDPSMSGKVKVDAEDEEEQQLARMNAGKGSNDLEG